MNIVVSKENVESNKMRIYGIGFIQGIGIGAMIIFLTILIQSGLPPIASEARGVIGVFFMLFSLLAGVFWPIYLWGRPKMFGKVISENTMDDSPDDDPSTTSIDSPAPPAE